MNIPFGLVLRCVAAEVNGVTWALIGVRPATGGVSLPRAEAAVVDFLLQLGWKRKADITEAPEPHPHWSLTLHDNGNYHVAWHGDIWAESTRPQPREWRRAVWEEQEATMVYLPTAGHSIEVQELMEAFCQDTCLLLTVPLREATFRT